jgi:hypothetical protein
MLWAAVLKGGETGDGGVAPSRKGVREKRMGKKQKEAEEINCSVNMKETT